MAKAIKKYENGLSIRFLKKEKRFFITFGVDHIRINDCFHDGFLTFGEAEKVLFQLTPKGNTKHSWIYSNPTQPLN